MYGYLLYGYAKFTKIELWVSGICFCQVVCLAMAVKVGVCV